MQELNTTEQEQSKKSKKAKKRAKKRANEQKAEDSDSGAGDGDATEVKENGVEETTIELENLLLDDRRCVIYVAILPNGMFPAEISK